MIFNHIGIATANIENSKSVYAHLGYTSGDIIYDPIQKVNLCFLHKVNAPTIELVAPTEATSPVNNILKKNGTMPYHSCYEVENIDNQILNLKKNKFMVVVKPVPAVAFNHRRIAFLFHKDAGLLELLESEK